MKNYFLILSHQRYRKLRSYPAIFVPTKERYSQFNGRKNKLPQLLSILVIVRRFFLFFRETFMDMGKVILSFCVCREKKMGKFIGVTPSVAFQC